MARNTTVKPVLSGHPRGMADDRLIQVDYLMQLDRQMACLMFVRNIFPNSPKKKDNIKCIDDSWTESY